MVSRKVVISNPTGLHLRPAGLFCKLRQSFAAVSNSVRIRESAVQRVCSVFWELREMWR